MKHSDRETGQPSVAKIKSAVPPKKSDNAKDDCGSPGHAADARTASNGDSKQRGVTVAPTPDTRRASRKRP
jgi:hypothetical protein